MKIITNDYGCGTSSSIIDYNIHDVIIVSENNYEFIYEINDDLFFVGHDFLLYLWDTEEKVRKWKSHKYRKAVWCFERVDAIFEIWKIKSLYSISMLKKFVDQIYVCDEDDVGKYGDWFPQWASPNFYNLKDRKIDNLNYLFSGQAGKVEYKIRTELLNNILKDETLKNQFKITNIDRTLTWDKYCDNVLSYKGILNPVGTLKGFNTRTYEVMYSGRILLQQKIGKYDYHESLLENHENIILFETFEELKSKLTNHVTNHVIKSNADLFFKENNIFERFKKIGVDIK